MERLMEVFEEQNNLMMYIEARVVVHGRMYWKDLSNDEIISDIEEWKESICQGDEINL